MNSFTKLLGCALAIVMLAGTTFAQRGPKVYPYKAGSTIGMVADIVAQVAGDKAKVTNIIGEGVDPHLYKPTRNDILSLMRSDIIFYSGLMLEGKMADALIKVATRGKPVFAVTELLDEKFLLEPKEFAGHFDPHVWMDVRGWMKGVDVVAKTLSEWDPKNAAAYKANAASYNAKLKGLDEYVARAISTIPKRSRVLVTAHDAFNYFGRAYEIDVVGIQGISTASQAGLQDLNRIVDLLVKRDIKAVFVESSVSEKNVRALVEGAKSKGHHVFIGGKLFSDAMGRPGTYEGTYFGMLDHNATTVARALGGKAPVKGMNGKLTHVK
ncbi:MAG: zinc ABC transporter substrate-binding protein [Planctomycetota bacterium]|jgi:manganese/zinc/iron transport system substrate-binding protein|nr:zinc ABC transporter substrate-binding protein [Planctomycetota bacterium]